MSMENARKFYEKVKADQGLQQKIGGAAKENPQGIGAFIIQTAKGNGFEFTEEEMKAFMAEEAKKTNLNGELGDAELESVAGGSKANWALNSVFSLGLACAGSAALKAAHVGCSLDNDIGGYH